MRGAIPGPVHPAAPKNRDERQSENRLRTAVAEAVQWTTMCGSRSPLADPVHIRILGHRCRYTVRIDFKSSAWGGRSRRRVPRRATSPTELCPAKSMVVRMALDDFGTVILRSLFEKAPFDKIRSTRASSAAPPRRPRQRRDHPRHRTLAAARLTTNAEGLRPTHDLPLRSWGSEGPGDISQTMPARGECDGKKQRGRAEATSASASRASG